MAVLWVIECRAPDGTLDFTGPQPEQTFGTGASTGMDDLAMAKAIWRNKAGFDAVLGGQSIADWPKVIDPRWTARRKTW